MRLPALLLLLAAAVLITFHPVLNSRSLSFDDNEYLTENHLVQTPGFVSAGRFMTEVLEPSTVRGYYQPLSMTSLMLDYAAGGRPTDLRAFHRTGLLLHVLNTTLLGVFLYLLFDHAFTAVLVAALFGLHPVATECLPWLAQRKTLLATFFGLACLIAYLGFVRTRSWSFYAFSLFAYVLALLSKPTATPLAVALILLDRWPLQNLNRRTLLNKVPFLLIAAAFSAITVISQSRTGGTIPPDPSSWTRGPLILGYTTTLYLRNLLWPVGFPAYYPFPEPFSLANRAVLAHVVMGVVLAIAVVASARRSPRWLVGFLIFFVTIFPTLGLIGFTDVIAANRFLYLPMIGLLIPIADVLPRLWMGTPNRRRALARLCIISIGCAVLLAEAVASRAALVPWRDTTSLFRYLLENLPGAPDDAVGRIRYNLGNALADSGDRTAAIEEYRAAIELAPNLARAHNNLAVELVNADRPAEAVVHFDRALQLDSRNANALSSYGAALVKLGRPIEGLERFRQALQVKPDLLTARFNLGCTLMDLRRFDEAAVELQQVVDADSNDADAHAFLGHCLEQMGRVADALNHYRAALAINPVHPAAQARAKALSP